MSMTKKNLEIKDWAEELVELHGQRSIHKPIARHQLRTLPWWCSLHLSVFWEEQSFDDIARCFNKLRETITTVCNAHFESTELENLHLKLSSVEKILSENQTLFLDEQNFRSDLDTHNLEKTSFDLLGVPLFQDVVREIVEPERPPTGELVNAVVPFLTALEKFDAFSFWRDWYQGFLDGKLLDWELQRRVALIDNAIWNAGPEAVAEEIERIRAESPNASLRPVSPQEKSSIVQHVEMNRDALAVSTAGLLDQLGSFKEHVRGINHLEAGFREELLTFVEELSIKLNELLTQLPSPGQIVSNEKANLLALWLRDYKCLARDKLRQYASPQSVADATVPTSIVLAATGIGAMMGAPLAGSVVGGLIANQMGPGQAAKELLKPRKSEGEGS